MNALRHTALLPIRTLLIAGAGLVCLSAGAAGNANDAQVRYEKERAACMNGQSNQDRKTCLREAGAALAQSRQAGNDGSTNYEANATKRCDPLPAADRKDCMARMQGQGSTSGSVASGGIVRELVTVEPAAAGSAPAGSAAPQVPTK